MCLGRRPRKDVLRGQRPLLSPPFWILLQGCTNAGHVKLFGPVIVVDAVLLLLYVSEWCVAIARGVVETQVLLSSARRMTSSSRKLVVWVTGPRAAKSPLRKVNCPSCNCRMSMAAALPVSSPNSAPVTCPAAK